MFFSRSRLKSEQGGGCFVNVHLSSKAALWTHLIALLQFCATLRALFTNFVTTHSRHPISLSIVQRKLRVLFSLSPQLLSPNLSIYASHRCHPLPPTFLLILTMGAPQFLHHLHFCSLSATGRGHCLHCLLGCCSMGNGHPLAGIISPNPLAWLHLLTRHISS